MLYDITKVFAREYGKYGTLSINFAFFPRPFGVALLFAGFDPDHGSQLFHMDPSGTYVQYDAKAIGSGSEGAQQSLQVHPTTDTGTTSGLK